MDRADGKASLRSDNIWSHVVFPHVSKAAFRAAGGKGRRRGEALGSMALRVQYVYVPRRSHIFFPQVGHVSPEQIRSSAVFAHNLTPYRGWMFSLVLSAALLDRACHAAPFFFFFSG